MPHLEMEGPRHFPSGMGTGQARWLFSFETAEKKKEKQERGKRMSGQKNKLEFHDRLPITVVSGCGLRHFEVTEVSPTTQSLTFQHCLPPKSITLTKSLPSHIGSIKQSRLWTWIARVTRDTCYSIFTEPFAMVQAAHSNGSPT